MRTSLLAVIALLSALACTSRDKPGAPAASDGPEKASAPAVQSPAVPQISKWELDPENSSAAFVCKHVFSNVRGMFQQPSGTLILDDAAPANSKVNATIKVSSITTGVEERDTHLKGAQFFVVTRNPLITFIAGDVNEASATLYPVTGVMEMHGVTKPVTLAVTVSPPFNHAGGIRRGIEATTSVNRRDFGLVWDFPGEGTGVVVGDNIKITIDAELVLQPETSKRG